MDAPQSRDEVEPVERALRQLDARLAIQWEPKAVMTARGSYDVMGKATAPRYDGRWKIVVRGDPNRTAMWREDSLVTYVTTPVTVGSGTDAIQAMQADGPYAPVGWWVVDLMQSWDRANREAVNRFSALMNADNDRQDAKVLEDAQAGEAQVLDRMFFEGTMRGGVSTQHPVAIDLVTETR